MKSKSGSILTEHKNIVHRLGVFRMGDFIVHGLGSVWVSECFCVEHCTLIAEIRPPPLFALTFAYCTDGQCFCHEATSGSVDAL